MVLAQPRAKKSKNAEEPAVEETAPVETTQSNQSMGPIGAGIGFCVLFAAVVVYLCRKDYLEKQEEKEKAEAEAKALEAAGAEEKPQQVGAGDGVELASLETCSTKGDEVVADRV